MREEIAAIVNKIVKRKRTQYPFVLFFMISSPRKCQTGPMIPLEKHPGAC
jgi:hypothetical protein